MNGMKLYIFDVDSYPYKVKVYARTILEAKEKVKSMKFKYSYFSHIKIIEVK